MMETIAQPPLTSHSYRLSPSVGIELIFGLSSLSPKRSAPHSSSVLATQTPVIATAAASGTSTTNTNTSDNNPPQPSHTPPPQVEPVCDYDGDGLKAITMTNFSGRIVVHRTRSMEASYSSDFSRSSIGSLNSVVDCEQVESEVAPAALLIANATTAATTTTTLSGNETDTTPPPGPGDTTTPTTSRRSFSPKAVVMEEEFVDDGEETGISLSCALDVPATTWSTSESVPAAHNNQKNVLRASSSSTPKPLDNGQQVSTQDGAGDDCRRSNDNSNVKLEYGETTSPPTPITTTTTLTETPLQLPNKSMHDQELQEFVEAVLKFKRMKRNIPEEIRERRRALRCYGSVDPMCQQQEQHERHAGLGLVRALANTAPVFVGHGGERGEDSKTTNIGLDVAPTPLHELCAKSQVTLEELWKCYKENPDAVCMRDSHDRYPLHILAENETLITSPGGGIQTATVFGNHLINEFPAAITAPDSDGCLPFFNLLSDWIDWANDQHKLSKDEYTMRRDVDEDKSLCYPGTSTKLRLFPRVEIWEEVEWCFAMLSTELDVLGRNHAMPAFQLQQQEEHNRRAAFQCAEPLRKRDNRTILVERLLEQLPRLIPTVLLVEDDGVGSRVRVMEMTIFRRLWLCPQTDRKWVTDMLNYGGVPARRAVDYLWMISHTSIDDYTGGFGAALPRDLKRFDESRQGVFDRVSELKGSIASLVTLPTKEMERAASTPVVWHAMGNKLSRPFVLGVVLIDLVLHITLMVTFRSSAGVQPQLGQSHERIGAVDTIIFTISTHYVIRTVSEVWAMWAVSVGAFKSYILDMWNIFSISAILLTLLTTLVNGSDDISRHGLNAFVVGLLWMKVLAFLKVVNKDMATFILALSQILYDIRFFVLVLAVCVLMFGDMFHIAVSQQDNGEVCEQEEGNSAMDDFCSTAWESYLRVYAILLGDIELDDLTATSGTTALFIIFTVFGVIVLLNVLIAIISDSYEKATLRGHVLFGRARVKFVAQNEALENFLKPRKRRINPDRIMRHRVKAVGRWSILIVILLTALITEAWLVSVVVHLFRSFAASDVAYGVLALLLSILLAAALWVVSTFLLDDLFRWLLPDSTEFVYDALGKFNRGLVRSMASIMFGLELEKVESVSAYESSDQEWTGRLKYMEHAMGELIADVKRDLRSEIRELKTAIQDGNQYH